MASEPMDSKEAGASEWAGLSHYGQPLPPASWRASPHFGSELHQPPPSSQHWKLERLNIYPASDPRINKAEAMEYMQRNPPPPIGHVNIAETSELSHQQNMTRNLDSHGGWAQGQVSAMQRLKNFFSSTTEPWTFISKQFDTGSLIWSAPTASNPGLTSPPVSSNFNLGSVSTRPCLNPGLEAKDRAQQFTNLCNIFPRAQVKAVMTLLPHEKDIIVLCKKIVDLYT